MYSLELTCIPEQVDELTAELWDYGTVAISENDFGATVRLLAGFATDENRPQLLNRFADFEPIWEEDNTDWEAETRRAWPPRSIGARIFLAPPWSSDPTPPGRLRVLHNPGSASGTGEHPCTQLVLEALEHRVTPAGTLADIGTGSGILAVTATLLGARAVAVDTDLDSLPTARENFALNGLPAPLVAGSADCLAAESATVVVANISGTVLLSILDDLLRILAPNGTLILSGFIEPELRTFTNLFPHSTVSACHEWRCLTTSVV